MTTAKVAEAYGVGTIYEVSYHVEADTYMASVSSGPSTSAFGWDGRFDWQSMGDVLEAVGRAIELELMEQAEDRPATPAADAYLEAMRESNPDYREAPEPAPQIEHVVGECPPDCGHDEAWQSLERADAQTRSGLLGDTPAEERRRSAKAYQDAVTGANPKATRALVQALAGPCGCECTSGGFCGGCGHAGCGRR